MLYAQAKKRKTEEAEKRKSEEVSAKMRKAKCKRSCGPEDFSPAGARRLKSPTESGCCYKRFEICCLDARIAMAEKEAEMNSVYFYARVPSHNKRTPTTTLLQKRKFLSWNFMKALSKSSMKNLVRQKSNALLRRKKIIGRSHVPHSVEDANINPVEICARLSVLDVKSGGVVHV